jgi:hypothetical protein
MPEQLFCQQPDRDSPGMKCGYPLPCPFHTAVIDLDRRPPLVILNETNICHVDRLLDLADCLVKGESDA